MEDKWWAFKSLTRVLWSWSRLEHFLGESLRGKAGWLPGEGLPATLAQPGSRGLQALVCDASGFALLFLQVNVSWSPCRVSSGGSPSQSGAKFNSVWSVTKE